MAKSLFVCLHNAGRLADRKPRELTRADAEWADVVVTMGCGDECPYIPGKHYKTGPVLTAFVPSP